MDILLDTNIILQHASPGDKSVEMVMDYLAKTNSRIVIPRLVFDELKGKYRRNLTVDLEQFQAAAHRLSRTLVSEVRIDVPKIDINEETEKRSEALLSRFGVSKDNLLETDNSILPELIRRAVDRVKPLGEDGQQFRDGVLWLTLMKYVQPDKPISFISNNKKDFAQSNGVILAQQLIEECQQAGVLIHYFTSLSDFLNAHAHGLAAIDDEWIDLNIDFSRIEGLVIESLGSKEAERVCQMVDVASDERAGEATMTGYSDVFYDQYFIYEKMNGELLLNLSVQVHVEYSIDVIRTVHESDLRIEMRPRVSKPDGEVILEEELVPYYSSKEVHKEKFILAEFFASFVIALKDLKPATYEITDWGFL